VGFHVRVCPVKRLATATNGHRIGAEVDAFLAAVFRDSSTSISREQVYRDWFAERVGNEAAIGASLVTLRVAGMSRTRVVRRTHAAQRSAQVLERPQVHLEGEFVIHDGLKFLGFLAHGVGRHRGFGFGAVILVPPGPSKG
jgi:CRISPR system Cascade subunit CasE